MANSSAVPRTFLGLIVIAFLLAAIIFVPRLSGGTEQSWSTLTSAKVRLAHQVPDTDAQMSIVEDITSETTSTTTIAYKEIYSGIVSSAKQTTPMYVQSDSAWFSEWSKRVKWPSSSLPRVLILTWCTESAYYRYINEVYWKCCYAHAHGFDITFTSEKNFTGKKGWNWPMFSHLGYNGQENNDWAWVYAVHEYLEGGRYDYVFLMTFDTLIQQHNLDFPIWAWDRGHDITLMDQYHFVYPEAYGLNVNNVLFKNTEYTKQFLKDLWNFRGGFYLFDDEGPFMVNLLVHLSREAKEWGKAPYTDSCSQWMRLGDSYDNMMHKEYHKFAKIAGHFSACFFKELDRMVGAYGFRFSNHIGFSTTFNLQPSGNRLLPEYYTKPSVLGPWANCWRNIRKWWPKPERNCFAFRWNGPHMVLIPAERAAMYDFVQGQCPDPTFDWWWSPFNNRLRGDYLTKEPSTPIIVNNQMPFHTAGDWIRFLEWAPRIGFTSDQKKLPRVLIYTWIQEDWIAKYVNEVHWKSCYAHMHGYEIIFSPLNISLLNGFDQWVSQENMWAWWPDIQQYLFSGDYDYVLMTAVNSLISEQNLDFPVWAWDTGHDITIMDENLFDSPNPSGLNMNNILFKASDAAREFGDQVFKFRKGFDLLEGDNGPFMESILKTISAGEEAAGKTGYDHQCLKYLNQPVKKWSDGMKKGHLNRKYQRCFFEQLDHLVGGFGKRQSKTIGFSSTYMMKDDSIVLPYQVHGEPGLIGPWANCWSSPRKTWTDPELHCFAFRWNESEVMGEVVGVCPDDSFKWETFAYNPANRGWGR